MLRHVLRRHLLQAGHLTEWHPEGGLRKGRGWMVKEGGGRQGKGGKGEMEVRD